MTFNYILTTIDSHNNHYWLIMVIVEFRNHNYHECMMVRIMLDDGFRMVHHGQWIQAMINSGVQLGV